MAIGFDFKNELQGSWETAQPALIEQLTRLFAALGPLGPLLNGLAIPATPQTAGGYLALATLTTDATGAPSFTTGFGPPVTPGAVTVSTNDYDPGVSSSRVIRLSSTGAVNLTGMRAPTVSSERLLVNIGAFTITLTHADTASAAVNRWRCPGAANFALTTFKAVWVWYDTNSSVWQVIG